MSEWQIGDLPEMHPAWEQQVKAEEDMWRGGRDAFMDRTKDARRKNQMSRVKPLERLTSEWFPLIVRGLKEWLREASLAHGAYPVAYAYLNDCDPAAASLVALRAVLNGLYRDRTITSLAVSVGAAIEHEHRIRQWETQARAEAKDDPEGANSYQANAKYLKRSDATSGHRARVNIFRANALLENGWLQWEPWPEEAQFRVGVTMIELIIRHTRWFRLESDPEPKRRSRHMRAPIVLQPLPEFVTWLDEQLDRCAALEPHLKPTLIPPKRWEGTRGGGYYTPYVKAPRMISFRAHQESQRKMAADEYDALEMPDVRLAIHMLQETPWRLNARVNAVAQALRVRHKAVKGMPDVYGQPEPKKPRDIETNPEAAKKWRRSAKRVKNENYKNSAKVRAVNDVLGIAFEYRNAEEFYFPHKLDFRARIYPIPYALQPQGTDFAKGQLEFANGVPITEENGGVRWLAIQLASMWGHDKQTFAFREAWVRKNAAMFKKIAKDPVKHYTLWAEADKPWQALAAALEWADYLAHGDGFVSHLPIVVDGTCNGIQHLAALSKDEAIARLVNVTPGDKPEDIYAEVARRLQPILEELIRVGGGETASSQHAKFWLDVCGGSIPRKLTKRPVMVLPYGATREAYRKYINEWLDEEHPLDPNAATTEWKLRWQRVIFLVDHMWGVVRELVGPGLAIMSWLQECARACAEGNQPIYWNTPSGMTVRHFYGTRKAKRVFLRLDGNETTLNLPEYTTKLDLEAQTRGIAPNFIHSLDASALVTTLKFANEAGIKSVVAIHDAYGTHAGNMDVLVGLIRKGFVETHAHDLLGEFRRACAAVLTDYYVVEKGVDPGEAMQMADEKLPPLLETGSLDLRSVMESPYFFA